MRTPARLAGVTCVAGQLLDPDLARHGVADPNHGIFNVVDRLVLDIQALRFFLGKNRCYQHFDPRFSLFFRDLPCHPWLLYLNSINSTLPASDSPPDCLPDKRHRAKCDLHPAASVVAILSRSPAGHMLKSSLITSIFRCNDVSQ
jgi:hypothetical protein